MRKYIIFTLAILFSQLVSAQQNSPDLEIKKFEKAQNQSLNNHFEDIPESLTYVVINNDNSMSDLFFKDAVAQNWHITEFEFCSQEKFQEIKCDTNYYFLLRAKRFPKNGKGPAYESISFVKGNNYVGNLLKEMPELVSMPMFHEDDHSGRIYSYLPAYMEIMQNAIQRIVDGKSLPYRQILHTEPLSEITGKTILFREGDISYPISQKELETMFHGRVKIVSQDEIDNAINGQYPNTLVSLVIGPDTPTKGAFCYKMLLDTQTKELYYYKRHRSGSNKPTGFIKKDIKALAKPFKKLR